MFDLQDLGSDLVGYDYAEFKVVVSQDDGQCFWASIYAIFDGEDEWELEHKFGSANDALDWLDAVLVGAVWGDWTAEIDEELDFISVKCRAWSADCDLIVGSFMIDVTSSKAIRA